MNDIDIDAKQRTVDDFNAEHLRGTWVRYWTGTRQDPAKYGQTRSKAELLSGHTPVIWVTTHGACIALTHVDVIPGQPDDIEDDSHDLPEPRLAAERVVEYIAANGDGIYDVIDGHPLYARDLEALRHAGEKVDELTAALAEAREQAKDSAYAADSARKGLMETRAALAERDTQLTQSRAQATTYANKIGTLTAENARLRQQRDAHADVVDPDDVGKCPQCGKQSRSYSRGCSQCGFGRPSVDELTAALERALDAKYAALGEVGRVRAELGKTEDKLTAANRRADGLANDLRSANTANTAYANENARLRSQLAEIATGAAEVAKTGSDDDISRTLCADGIHEADGSCCNTWRSLEYIRSHYQVPAEVEGRVIANGRPGRIVGAEGTYLLIRIDGEHNPLPYHPTWEMQYVGAEATR